MYPIPPHEHLVEMKSCRQCGGNFPITDKDMEFYEKVSPIFGGKKYTIPPPTLCPECRQQRRLSFRNERKLYKRKSDISGKEIISGYSPDKPFIIYDIPEWYSDDFDPFLYGQIPDFSQSFFSQFSELFYKVPKQKTFNTNSNINSDYGNHTGDMKDCYLCSAGWYCTNVYYASRGAVSENCSDVLVGIRISECYEVVNLTDCKNCYFTKNCSNSTNLSACIDCNGCQDCMYSANLSNKKYCINNTQFSKEEYELKKDELQKKIMRAGWESLREVEHEMIHRNMNIIGSENSLGDGIVNVKNTYYAYDLSDLEDAKYVTLSSLGCSDVYDLDGFGLNFHKGYEGVDLGVNSMNNCFVVTTHECSDIYYSNNCYNSNNIFLCTGLRNASYCILNKQYTKEEYEILVPKIIERMMATPLRQGFEGQVEWGEFFPATMSPFGYNETVAQEYYPMTRDSVIPANAGIQNNRNIDSGSSSEGRKPGETFLHGSLFNWSDYESPFPKVKKIIKASLLPEDITKIPDDILNWAIECEVTGKPFRIIRQELEFYRKHSLPIPRRHPDQRHLDRMKQRNPRKLFERDCDCCKKPMITTYSPERPETVYCGACYEKEVIG